MASSHWKNQNEVFPVEKMCYLKFDIAELVRTTHSKLNILSLIPFNLLSLLLQEKTGVTKSRQKNNIYRILWQQSIVTLFSKRNFMATFNGLNSNASTLCSLYKEAVHY